VTSIIVVSYFTKNQLQLQSSYSCVFGRDEHLLGFFFPFMIHFLSCSIC